MSNYIAKTNAAPSQPQSWLSRIGQAFREAFSSPEVPKKKEGTDIFMRGAPLSVAASRRIGALTSGRGTAQIRSAAGSPSPDAQLVAYLNHISSTGELTLPDAPSTRRA